MTNILVLDDDASIRNLFVRLGARQHWEVAPVASGEEALIALKTNHFELAFVDVDRNDEPDGIELAKTLRENAPGLRIVMMSGNPNNDTRVEEAGFGAMLAKPFGISALEQLVESSVLPK